MSKHSIGTPTSYTSLCISLVPTCHTILNKCLPYPTSIHVYYKFSCVQQMLYKCLPVSYKYLYITYISYKYPYVPRVSKCSPSVHVYPTCVRVSYKFTTDIPCPSNAEVLLKYPTSVQRRFRFISFIGVALGFQKSSILSPCFTNLM